MTSWFRQVQPGAYTAMYTVTYTVTHFKAVTPRTLCAYIVKGFTTDRMYGYMPSWAGKAVPVMIVTTCLPLFTTGYGKAGLACHTQLLLSTQTMPLTSHNPSSTSLSSLYDLSGTAGHTAILPDAGLYCVCLTC